MALKSGWDIGMGKKYFYLFVNGRKKPVRRILVSDAYENYEDGYAWGEAEYKRYMQNSKIKTIDVTKMVGKALEKAGFGNQGLDIPEDWDTLSEDEKARRLKGVEGIMKEK
jgi:hypothetical protein